MKPDLKTPEEILKSYITIEEDMDVIQSIDIMPLDIIAAMEEYAKQVAAHSLSVALDKSKQNHKQINPKTL